MLLIALALALAQAAQHAQEPRIVFEEPPVAREPAGEIQAVVLGPLFRQPFACVEHYTGQMRHAGDALGTDCMPVAGIAADGTGFSRLYRSDGNANEDWYGWGVDVLSPVDGVVTGHVPNPRVNQPGTLGKPPAGLLLIKRSDGVAVMIGHVADVTVGAGDRVTAGEVIAKVGNNGPSRAPHIHIGAFRGDVPLQIRWDQRAMAKYQRGAGD